MERIDKLLGGTGRWSRKEAKELIRAGRVTAGGRLAVRPEEKCDPKAKICVDGERIFCEKYVYLMMHKPAGLVSATEDPREQTVLDLLPKEFQKMGLFPVGRLDKDTEGLLLLTNDGAAAHVLLAPGKHVDKVYFARVEGTLGEEDVRAFQEGMALKDGTVCLPAGLQILSPRDTCLVTLREGKYHQVKRMLAARGKPVLYLKRLAMGQLRLDENLPVGGWRFLTEEERNEMAR